MSTVSLFLSSPSVSLPPSPSLSPNLPPSLTQVCFEGNPSLQEEFNGSFYRPSEGLEENGSDWLHPPMCLYGIPGITRTKNIKENTDAMYLDEGEVRPGEDAEGNQVRSEIATSFFLLIGIFFPSVTGEWC